MRQMGVKDCDVLGPKKDDVHQRRAIHGRDDGCCRPDVMWWPVSFSRRKFQLLDWQQRAEGDNGIGSSVDTGSSLIVGT